MPEQIDKKPDVSPEVTEKEEQPASPVTPSAIDALVPIIKSFDPVFDDIFFRQLSQLKTNSIRELTTFKGIIEELSESLSGQPETLEDSRIAWNALKLSISKISNWTNGIPDKFLPAYQSLDSGFQKHLEQQPRTMSFTITDDDWRSAPDDPLRKKLWKRSHIIRFDSRRKIAGFGNFFRRLFKRPEKIVDYPQREFDLHLFLQCYLGDPLVEFNLKEWPAFLQLIAQQLYAAHQISTRIRDIFIPSDSIDSDILRIDATEKDEIDAGLKAALEEIDNFFLAFEGFEKAAAERFILYKQDLFGNLAKPWMEAGTHLLPENRFDGEHSRETNQRFEKQYQRYRQAWEQHFDAEREGWQKNLELYQLQLQIRHICYDILTSTEDKIRKQLVPAFSATEEALNASLQRLKAIDQEDKTAVKRAIAAESRDLQSALQEEKIPYMLDTLVRARLENTIESAIIRVQRSIDSISEEHTIFETRDLANLVPKSKVSKIALKDLVDQEAFHPFKVSHSSFTKIFGKKLKTIYRGISEIDDIAEFTLAAGMTLVEQKKKEKSSDDPHKTVSEGLHRAVVQVNELISTTQEMVEDTNSNLLDISATFDRQIRELADSKTIIDLQLRLARAKAREEFRNLYRRIINGIKMAIPKVRQFLRDSREQLQAGLKKLQKVTGITTSSADLESKLATFLNETSSRIQNLPFVYQRLFLLEPLKDERFYFPRTGAMKQLETQYQHWQHGHYAISALVGEQGNGRTTLINFAEKKIFQPQPSIWITISSETIFTQKSLFKLLCNSLLTADERQKVKNIDALEQLILEREERIICVVENIQHLFLRTVDGFDTLEYFLLFATRTNTKIYWLLSCAQYSWQYLNKVIQVEKFTQPPIHLESFTVEEIREIIQKRHRVSGYQMIFDAAEDVANSRKYRKLASEEERQKYLKMLFFKDLTEKAGGNLSVATLLWLMSIKVESKEAIRLPGTIDFDPSILKQLPAEELFTLAALLQHESLNTLNHARIFHQDEQKSLMQLERMHNLGYLQNDENGGYAIHPLLYRPTVQALKSQNIIH